jgi:hypothetical protein
MHLQISGSPNDTASNIRTIVNALAGDGVNIEGIGPAFDPPHVRVAVQHRDPYDPNDEDDPLNRALNAMDKAGLAPTIRPAVTIPMPNKPGALRAVLNRLMREGYEVESILVLAGSDKVQFGVAPTVFAGWDEEWARVEEAILGDLGRI